MIQEANRTIACLSPKCKKLLTTERSLFALAASPGGVECSCGGEAVHIELDSRRVTVGIDCAFCGKTHEGSFDARIFRKEKFIVFSCGERGLDCCYIGEDGPVRNAAHRLEETMERVSGADGGEIFQNDIIMHEVLSEVRDIAKRGGVSCACGGTQYKMKVGYNAVELQCSSCGASMRIPAATADDLDAVCCKTKLLIRGKGEEER